MVIKENEILPAKKFILWRCSNEECKTFQIRKSRIDIDSNVQSPCPKCGKRTRLNRGNTRIFADREDAEHALDLVRGRWL